MSQIRGSCGHLKASWDNHTSCFTCSRCSFSNRCVICKSWSSPIWTLVAQRRTFMGRKKTEDNKKRDKGASCTQDTASPAVESASDIRHSGSGTSTRKSQSEILSQTSKSASEDNLLTDTSRNERATSQRPGSLTTSVSADLGVESSTSHRHGTSHRPSRSPGYRSPGNRSPGNRSSDFRSSDSRSSTSKSPDNRAPGNRTLGDRSPVKKASDDAPGHNRSQHDRSSKHRSNDRSSKHRSRKDRSSRVSKHRSVSRSISRSSSRSTDSHEHRSSRSKHSRHRYRSDSYDSSTSSSSERHRYRKRKRAKRHRSVSVDKHRKRRHASHSRHRKHRSRGRKRSLSRRPHRSHKRRHISPSPDSVYSDKDDNVSVRVSHNDFEGESRSGSPIKSVSKSGKVSLERDSSDSENEEESFISFGDTIREVMNLLPPEICPRKESSDTPQKPRSTLDALNPADSKDLASLPQSLLIKDITNLLQSLINRKVKLEPGWVTNQTLEKELGINMKHYRSHGQLFPSNVPKLDKDASLLDLSSTGNASIPIKTLDTMERQVRNMVTINSYADIFAAASVKSLQSDDLDANLLKRMLSSLVNCLKHSSSMAVVLATELLQTRREAAIEKSKILTDTAKDKLRSVPISAEALFGGQVAEIQKSNSESQQQKFIASSLASGNKPARSSFKIPKQPPKSSNRNSSSSTPFRQRDRGGHRRGARRGGPSSRGRVNQIPSRGGASNVSNQ